MISKEEYEKLYNRYINYEDIKDLPNDIPIIDCESSISKSKSKLPIYEIDSIKALELLGDKEFISKLSETEIGYLVQCADIRNSDALFNIDLLYRALSRYYIDPNFHNKMQITFIKSIVENTHLILLIEDFYKIGFYYDELIEKCKNKFKQSIGITLSEYSEYYKKEININDIDKYSYEEYAIKPEYISGVLSGGFETCWKYPLWKHEEDEELKDFLSYL